MADPTLHGNGEDCPACALTREALGMPRGISDKVPCNRCGGIGRLGWTEDEIARRAAAEARVAYWPACEARWARQNAKGAVVAPAPFPWPPVALPWAQASFAF